MTLRAVSRFYRTPAWGRQDQPDFVNAVALVDTSLAPLALDLLLAVEAEFGRHRIAGERWGPRTLDLDLAAIRRCGDRCAGPARAAPAPA